MMRIHYLQHVPFEGPGSIEKWSLKRNFSLTSTQLFNNGTFPQLDDFDMLVIMGGPMGIYDEDLYPWIRQEKAFIRSAITAGKIMVGICLGSQLIADALGAKVYPGDSREIGWFPVHLTAAAAKVPFLRDFPSPATVMHWHGDTFDLPTGALHLMQSNACKNQAFLFNNRVLGLQFHLETTPESLHALVENCKDEITPQEYIQSEPEILSNHSLCASINGLLENILDGLAALHKKQ
jgi:GMP synthase-like glutamine amidotransferase